MQDTCALQTFLKQVRIWNRIRIPYKPCVYWWKSIVTVLNFTILSFEGTLAQNSLPLFFWNWPYMGPCFTSQNICEYKFEFAEISNSNIILRIIRIYVRQRFYVRQYILTPFFETVGIPLKAVREIIIPTRHEIVCMLIVCGRKFNM